MLTEKKKQKKKTNKQNIFCKLLRPRVEQTHSTHVEGWKHMVDGLLHLLRVTVMISVLVDLVTLSRCSEQLFC